MSASDRMLDDRFRLEFMVGAGGSGEVYRGVDQLENRNVAVKLMRTTDRPERFERFFREVAVLAELTHPAIVRYVAHGIAPDGNPFLVMEWLDGETLAQRLRRGPLSPRETWRLACRLSEGLSVAHARSIAHRDIKPSNIYLVEGNVDEAKIIDFGIAKRLLEERTQLTRTGSQIGTPAYMSPEQIRGETELDVRSDMFSLGATLYECLTGTPAFCAEHLLAIAAEICVSDPPWPRTLRDDIPAGLEALVLHMLEKQPERRPPDAAALERALHALGEPPGGNSSPLVPVTLAGTEQRVVAVAVIAGVELSDHTLDELHTTQPQPDKDQLLALASSFGAHLERMPEGLLVAFVTAGGTPTDQVARAVRLGASIIQLFPQASIAVAHGRAMRQGDALIGEVVERAASLVQGALPGVRLDLSSAELLRGQFDMAPNEWGASLLGEPNEQDKLQGHETPFVGRNIELSSILSAFEECCDEPLARGTLIMAPPGVGKTRLFQEFVSALGQKGRPFTLLLGQGDPIRSNAPFGLLSSLVRRAAQITSSDSLTSRMEKLQKLVEATVAPELATITAEFLGELTGVHFPDAHRPALQAARNDPRLMSDQIRSVWLTWLRAEVERGPVALVLEDLHWADLASVQLIDASLRSLQQTRLFVLALARPEVRERFPNLWAERAIEWTRLLPLTPRTAERLAQQVLGPQTDPALIRRIVQLAEGNAFFLEELMRTVASGRADVLPDNVMAMVQLRLDALGAEAARVLRAASIFGEEFTRAGVSALTAQSPSRLLEYWDIFERKELISKTDAEHCRFRHALVRETCYAALSPADRALGHLLAGEWLERAPDTAAAVLAHHFDRGERPERATHWYARASAHAVEGDDFQSALRLADRGLELEARGEPLAVLRLSQAQAHVCRVEIREALQRGEEALLAAEPGSQAWYLAIRELTVPLGETACIGRMRELSELLSLQTAQPEATETRLAALAWFGGAMSHVGEIAIAGRLLGLCERGLAQAEAGLWVHCQFQLASGMRLYAEKRLTEALVPMGRASSLGEEIRNARLACLARAQLGVLQLELGMLEEGCASERQARAQAKAASLAIYEMSTNLSLALGHWLMGKHAEAREFLELAAAQGGGTPRFEAFFHGYVARIESDLGDYRSAEAHARLALENAGEVAPLAVPARAVLAHVLVRAGRFSEALPLACEALTALEGMPGVEDFEALIPLTAAEALWGSGRQEEARRALQVGRERLLTRAAMISDAALRGRFLALRDHARTLQLAQEWFHA